jgi:hypothetical protein
MVKNKQKEKKKDGKVQGIATIGVGVGVGSQAIRSGVPRALGVRLEQHGTSKEAGAKIAKEGFLDPAYGGASGGVTSSMMLPKEFLERAKGHTFLSGKNFDHPLHADRNIFSPIGDVITRKIQVAGYRGSKAGKLTKQHVKLGSKIVGYILSPLTSPIEQRLKDITPEKYLEELRKEAEEKPEYEWRKKFYEQNKSDPKLLRENFNLSISNDKKILKGFDRMKKLSFDSKHRVKQIRTQQKQYKKLFDELKDDYQKWRKDNGLKGTKTKNIITEYGSYKVKIARSHKEDFEEWLKSTHESKNINQKKQKLLTIGKSLANHVEDQNVVKSIGLGAGWTVKLASSPAIGMLGVGKTLYVPGTDEYFNSEHFKYDQDDPFGNPFKFEKVSESGKGGFGGNALKTKEKVRAFGDRFSASKYLLEKEGDGNILKGAKKLITANPKRALAGLAILGVGGAASAALIKKGIDKIRQKDEHVKASTRKGKLVKAHIRRNPFFGKGKKKR